VHPAGGGALFCFPGAIARARERPFRVASAAVFGAGVRRRLRELAPIDRLVAHWIFPCAWPLCAGVDVPLDVVAHGADVRLLVAAPAPMRAAIVARLIDRAARFQFVAAHLLDALAASLPAGLAERLRASSRVEAAPIEIADVSVEAARLRASIEIADGERLAVCVGRLVAGKRVDLAIRAAARAGVRLVVAGEGPERAHLEVLARSCGARVTWAGALPREAALAWIAAADVLVHTSASEGAPTVVREARALGTRVVACAAGDLVRWSEADAGIEIVAPDPHAIAARIAAVPGRDAAAR
jgi:teichuronic acid biosynthesis glycosyltransferase TuaC